MSIEELIDQYVETTRERLPDMSVIAKLAQKSQEDRILRVSFKLTSEQYDALATYFKEAGQSGTGLVEKAIEELISIIT